LEKSIPVKSGMLDSDRQLVEGLKRKDIQTFEDFFSQYHRKIFGLIFKLTRNETDAQDLTQEVFLKVFEKVNTFQGRSAFSSWVYRIAFNTSLMKLRSRRKQPQLSLDALLPHFYESGYQRHSVNDWSRKADEQLLSRESWRVIKQAVDKLPEKERVVFVMRDVEEMSTEAVGDILGLSIPAVKSRLHRARLFLRKRLSKYFDEFAKNRSEG